MSSTSDGGLTKPKGFRGEFLLPGTEEYDTFRQPWNKDFAHRMPSVVLMPHGQSDVQIALNWVRENKLEFAVMCGGHSMSGRSLKDGAVLIRLRRMNHVHVDPKERTAWVEMGATVADFDAETNAYGLCGVGGHVSHTGMGGFALHGGYGCISRRYGLAVDNVLAARVVLANGTAVEASEEENQELLFAVRGAASMIGIVTSLKVRLFPLPEGPLICGGEGFWGADDDDEFSRLLHAWADVAQTCDPMLSTVCLWSSPPMAPFNGRRTIIVHASWLGDEKMDEAKAKLAEQLAPLFTLKQPLINALDPKPYGAFNAMQDPLGASNSMRTTSTSACDPHKLVQVMVDLEKHRPPNAAVGLEQWGGKVGTPDREPKDDVVYKMRQPFVLLLLAALDIPDLKEQALGWVAQSKQLFKERGLVPGAYLNYGDENAKPYGECTARLTKVKAKYDPNNVFPPIPGAI